MRLRRAVMKYAEVLEKIKVNLSAEKDLKKAIKNEEEFVEELSKQIYDKNEKLENARLEFPQVKETLIKGLCCVGGIVNNLTTAIKLNKNEDIVCDLRYNFMGKTMNLISDKYTLISKNGDVDLDFVIRQMFEKYLQIGDQVFNAKTIETLKETEKLYEKNPNLVKSRFEKIKLDNIWKHLEIYRGNLKGNFDCNIAKLEKLEDKIQKSKTYNNKLINKLFSKREKLQREQDDLLNKTEDLSMSIKVIDMEFADKSQMQEDVKEYVKAEIKSLFRVLNFINNFEAVKNDLTKFEVENLYKMEKSIAEDRKKLSEEEARLYGYKDMLKSTKRIKKETVSMALKDEQFVKEFNKLDAENIAKEDEEAFLVLYNKYDKAIAKEIKKLI